MDTFYEALSLYRRRKFEKSALLCTELLDKNPYDQVLIIKYHNYKYNIKQSNTEL